MITFAAANVAVSVVAFLLTLFFFWPSKAFCILYHAISVQPDGWQKMFFISFDYLLNFGTAHIISTYHSNYAYFFLSFLFFLCFFFFGPISGNKASRKKILIITAPSIFVLLAVTVSVYWYFRYLSTQRQPARGQYYLFFAKLLRSFTSSTRQKS